MSDHREGRGWRGKWGEPEHSRSICVRVGAWGVPSVNCRPHSWPVDHHSQKMFLGNVSAMRNNVNADFCFRKSVCFQREKEGEKMGENLGTSAQIGLNLCLSCHQLFSPLVRDSRF